MRSYTITPAVVKARQKQMNIPKRIFILESREKGWSDEKMAKVWNATTGDNQSHQSFNNMRNIMSERGQTLEELYKLRKELV